MFTKDSRILNNRLTVPLTSVSNAVGDVFKPTLDQLIKPLFANNEQGFFYDPNDLSTMFQDSAGTVPVTSVGQPVGLIRDKSGRNNHAYQTDSASHPILRKNAVTGANYLEFDGFDDFLQTNNIDFTGTDKVSLFAGVRKQSTTLAMLCELSPNLNINNGCFYLTASGGSSASSSFTTKGTTPQNGSAAAITGYDSPITIVLTGKGGIAQDLSEIRINGVLGSSATADQGAGNYGNHPLYIGRRGGTSLPFNGHIYGLISIGKLTTDSETAAIEKEFAKHTGVTLNV